MKLLIDNALSRHVAGALRQAGHDAVHVRDYGMGAAGDAEIVARAAVEDRIIVSADTDFGTLLALGGARKPSVILFRREANLLPDVQVALLVANLPRIADELDQGAVVIVEQSRLRVRSLPIHGD